MHISSFLIKNNRRILILFRNTIKGLTSDFEIEPYYFCCRRSPGELKWFIMSDQARDGLNWYAYVGNNPINRVDPTGLSTDEIDYRNHGVSAEEYNVKGKTNNPNGEGYEGSDSEENKNNGIPEEAYNKMLAVYGEILNDILILELEIENLEDDNVALSVEKATECAKIHALQAFVIPHAMISIPSVTMYIAETLAGNTVTRSNIDIIDRQRQYNEAAIVKRQQEIIAKEVLRDILEESLISKEPMKYYTY